MAWTTRAGRRDLTPQGTIELPAESTLGVVGIMVDSAGLTLSWASLPDKAYAVQYKATLSAPGWTTIGTLSSIGTVTTFTDSDRARLSQGQGFYQVTALR